MTIDQEIAAYETMAQRLERDHRGRWVLIHEGRLVGNYATAEEAAAIAVQRFGRGPYLIRQVGAPPLVIPASVAYRVHA